jgi:hypothetical protein
MYLSWRAVEQPEHLPAMRRVAASLDIVAPVPNGGPSYGEQLAAVERDAAEGA